MSTSAVDTERRPRQGVAARQTDRRSEAADFRAYAQRRDAQARERLVRAYLPLAHTVARRFHRGGRVALDDLQQVAALGMIKALDRYDPDHRAAFSTFAVATMEGEIRRYFRDFSWMVRPPRDLQERAVRIEREREGLTHALGRNPTAGELATRIGCTVEEIVDASYAAQARGSESFDRTFSRADEDGDTLGERLGAEDPGFAAAEAAATLERLLDTLPERDRMVVHLRFREDLTQGEIGRLIGCSQMHVSRILRTALAQLADAATHQESLRHSSHGELVLD